MIHAPELQKKSGSENSDFVNTEEWMIPKHDVSGLYENGMAGNMSNRIFTAARSKKRKGRTVKNISETCCRHLYFLPGLRKINRKQTDYHRKRTQAQHRKAGCKGIHKRETEGECVQKNNQCTNDCKREKYICRKRMFPGKI